METQVRTPQMVFMQPQRLVVPLFQRPYVWNQDAQWEPLWDDVRNTTERYLDELGKLGNEGRSEAERQTPAHFLCAVVLKQEPVATIDIERRHVIDGQQRLTTLHFSLTPLRKSVRR